MGGNIGESTTAEVGKLGIVINRLGCNECRQVGANGGFLVPWTGEVVAESAGAGNPCDLWGDSLRATHSSDIRAGAWENWCESGALCSVVGLAASADTCLDLD